MQEELEIVKPPELDYGDVLPKRKDPVESKAVPHLSKTREIMCRTREMIDQLHDPGLTQEEQQEFDQLESIFQGHACPIAVLTDAMDDINHLGKDLETYDKALKDQEEKINREEKAYMNPVFWVTFWPAVALLVFGVFLLKGYYITGAVFISIGLAMGIPALLKYHVNTRTARRECNAGEHLIDHLSDSIPQLKRCVDRVYVEYGIFGKDELEELYMTANRYAQLKEKKEGRKNADRDTAVLEIKDNLKMLTGTDVEEEQFSETLENLELLIG